MADKGGIRMILADKITEERKKNGWSQEELADKLGVSRQAVSKWESAGSTPDLQRVIQLAQLFDVSTDYLLRDEVVRQEETICPDIEIETKEKGSARRVSMEEANSFLDLKQKSAPAIANAIFLCVISPSLLILFSMMTESMVLPISETTGEAIGMLFLFLTIAPAVFIFITKGLREKSMEYLEQESFETAYGVSGMVKERKRAYEPTFSRGLAIGVVLCIVAVIPLVVAGVLEERIPEYVYGICLVFLLFVVAVGVNLIVRVSIVKGSYEALLQEGEFTKKEKKAKGKLDVLSGIYWCIVTAIYLGWSFSTARWDFTWIIWPVAGVLFGAISGIVRLKEGTEN